MRNRDKWQPSKYVTSPGGLRASRDSAQVAPASRFVTDHVAPQYEAMLRAHARGRLLDLGCGQAPLFGVYGELVSEVVCVDWPHSPHALAHVDVEVDLAGPLPFGDAEFDTVLSTDVLEHLEDADSAFHQISRVLGPGGKLLLATPFLYWIHEAPRDFARYTSFMLERLCSRHGLRVVALEATGGSPEVVLDMLGRHLAWSDTLTLAWGGAARALQRMPGVRQLSKYSERWFPLGFSLVAERDSSKTPASL